MPESQNAQKKLNGTVLRHDPNLQPNWAGMEDNAVIENPEKFIEELVKENRTKSLATRGYSLLELSDNVMETYDRFSRSLDAFFNQNLEEKSKFATKMMGPTNQEFTPNQYHGYSRLEGLKEQYMIRGCGKGSQLLFPGTYKTEKGESPHFGEEGLKLFEQLDQLCRETLHGVCIENSLPLKNSDKLVDVLPSLSTTRAVSQVQSEIECRQVGNGILQCGSSYFYPGFVSSSLLDVFHYSNTFHAHDDSHVKFKNNHSSHTDSGILTVVPCADVAGLEVFDQKLQQWIALEELVHQVANAKSEMGHRRYAVIFWGDSVMYLKKGGDASLHRVARSDLARHSIVYKMRTEPIVTAPRYQEDYEIADIQDRSLTNAGVYLYQKEKAFFSAVVAISAALFGSSLFL